MTHFIRSERSSCGEKERELGGRGKEEGGRDVGAADMGGKEINGGVTEGERSSAYATMISTDKISSLADIILGGCFEVAQSS